MSYWLLSLQNIDQRYICMCDDEYQTIYVFGALGLYFLWVVLHRYSQLMREIFLIVDRQHGSGGGQLFMTAKEEITLTVEKFYLN